MLVGFVLLGVVAGAGTGFVFLAQQRLKPYQSRARWVPALVVGRRFGELALLAVVMLGGAALGGTFGLLGFLGLEAAAR